MGRPRLAAKIEQQIRDQLAAGGGILEVAGLVGVGAGAVQRVKREVMAGS
jgi:hypothetical protein